MFAFIRRPFDKMYQTLLEGHYKPTDTKSIWMSLLKSGKKKPMPEHIRIAIAQNTFGTTRTIGKRAMTGAVASLIAMKAMLYAGIAMAAVGLIAIGYDYLHSRRTRKDVIREVNFAGQTVEGTRADLCRLYQAQMNILSISATFKKASMQSTTEMVDLIALSVSEEAKRVKVIDAGRYNAPADRYEFTEHAYKLVNDEDSPFRQAWESKAFSEEEIVQRLVALERGLPAHIIAEVNKRLEPEAPAAAPKNG